MPSRWLNGVLHLTERGICHARIGGNQRDGTDTLVIQAEILGVRAGDDQFLQELIVASSYSKNFGLYNERVGAITLVAADASVADTAFSQVKYTIQPA